MNNSYILNGQEFLFCPICGKRGYIRLGKHLSAVHPNVEILDCKVVTDAYSEERRQQLKEQRRHDKKFVENQKKSASKQLIALHQDKEFEKSLTDKASKARSYRWKNDPNFASEMNRKLTKGKNKWLEDEANRQSVRDKARAEMIESWKSNPLFVNNSRHGVRSIYTDSLSRTFYLRSSLEDKTARLLDEIMPGKWDYEAVRIPYIYEGIEHIYIPDFLLENNILLEVKPSYQIEDTIVQAKKSSAINAGYTYHFITEKDLSLESFRCKLA